MPLQQTVIDAAKPTQTYLHDLWRFRDLWMVLAWRDISVRYKDAAFGVLWVILQPLLMMSVFVVVFSKVAKLPSTETLPYPILVLLGLLPWRLISTTVSMYSESLVLNNMLISKVYLPRLIIPLSTLPVVLVEFGVSVGIFIVMAIWYGLTPSLIGLISIPFLLLLSILLASGWGILLAAANVYYRDVRYAIPFLIQVATYLSPVGYTAELVPEKWQFLYGLNPVVGVIESFRWAFSGLPIDQFPVIAAGISVAWTFVGLGLGLMCFRRVEGDLADKL